MEAARLQVHYYFNDDSHTMNAFIRHKCEGELLAIAKEILTTFAEDDFELLSEISEEGGFVDWIRLQLKDPTTPIKLAAATAILGIVSLVMQRFPPIHPEQLKNLQLQNAMIPLQTKLIEAQTKAAESQNELNNVNIMKSLIEIENMGDNDTSKII